MLIKHINTLRRWISQPQTQTQTAQATLDAALAMLREEEVIILGAGIASGLPVIGIAYAPLCEILNAKVIYGYITPTPNGVMRTEIYCAQFLGAKLQWAVSAYLTER